MDFKKNRFNLLALESGNDDWVKTGTEIIDLLGGSMFLVNFDALE